MTGQSLILGEEKAPPAPSYWKLVPGDKERDIPSSLATSSGACELQINTFDIWGLEPHTDRDGECGPCDWRAGAWTTAQQQGCSAESSQNADS